MSNATDKCGQSETCDVVVIGAGPAGLAAADELTKQGRQDVVVLEAHDCVGGLSRTVRRGGCGFDVGPHRFFTRSSAIQDHWISLLGDDLRQVIRESHIYYDGKLYHYPLRATNALWNLGPFESWRVVLSYLGGQLRPVTPEHSFEDWVSNRFGRRLFEHFFRDYTEKVWGRSCKELSADWAAQRIRNMSLKTVIARALGIGGRVRSLTGSFYYPRHGSGQVWNELASKLHAAGVEVRCNAAVSSINVLGRGYRLVTEDGASLRCQEVVSTMPLGHLARILKPQMPEAVRDAAAQLRHRGVAVAVLVLDQGNLFSDQWIYVNSSRIRVGRIQNIGNWSRDLIPEPDMSCLGLEYFYDADGEFDRQTDQEIVKLAISELRDLGLAREANIVEHFVVREPMAYPVYDDGYAERIAVIRHGLAGLPGLACAGRNGMHRYNNMDHAMLSGIEAARSLRDPDADPWSVNEDDGYHEELRSKAAPA